MNVNILLGYLIAASLLGGLFFLFSRKLFPEKKVGKRKFFNLEESGSNNSFLISFIPLIVSLLLFIPLYFSILSNVENKLNYIFSGVIIFIGIYSVVKTSRN